MGDSIGRPLPERDARRVDGGALVGRILGEQNVRYCFTINGGHIWPILSHLRENGVEMIHMRHEQSCAYAADAWARVSGQVGVLAVTCPDTRAQASAAYAHDCSCRMWTISTPFSRRWLRIGQMWPPLMVKQ